MSKAVMDFLRLPDAGERVLRHLEVVAGRELPGRGIVAGQACTSAILELCHEAGAVYNDVDIFLPESELPDRLKRRTMMRHGSARMRVDSFGAEGNVGGDSSGYAGTTVSRLLSLAGVERDGPLNYVYGRSLCTGLQSGGGSPARLLVESFDLNSVKVGVDLATGVLEVAPSAVSYFQNRQLRIDFVHAGLQTFVRFLEKRALEGNYGDVEGARAVAFLHTLSGMGSQVSELGEEGEIVWTPSAQERWAKLKVGGVFKDLMRGSSVMGKDYWRRAQKVEDAWGEEYDLVKVREEYTVYGRGRDEDGCRERKGSREGADFYYIKPRKVPACIVGDKEVYAMLRACTKMGGSVSIPGVTHATGSLMHFYRLFDKSTTKLHRKRILDGCRVELGGTPLGGDGDLEVLSVQEGKRLYVRLAWAAQTTREGLVPAAMLQERSEMGGRFLSYERGHEEVVKVLMKLAPSYGLYQLLLKRLVDHNEDLWGMRDHEAVRVWNRGLGWFLDAYFASKGESAPRWLRSTRDELDRQGEGKALTSKALELVSARVSALVELAKASKYTGPKYVLSPEHIEGVGGLFELGYWMTSREFLSGLTGIVLQLDLGASAAKKAPMVMAFPGEVFPGLVSEHVVEGEGLYGGSEFVCEYGGAVFEVREGLSVLDLEEQGRALRQCVGSYGNVVKSKRSRIFFLRRRNAEGVIEEQSTLEVGFQGRVSLESLILNTKGAVDRCKAVVNLQHRKEQNRAVSAELAAFADAIVEAIRGYGRSDEIWFAKVMEEDAVVGSTRRGAPRRVAGDLVEL